MITKEQLIECGWVLEDRKTFDTYVLGRYELRILSDKTIRIWDNISEDSLYLGKCSNSFQLRFIMGLLGIQSFSGAELLGDTKKYVPGMYDGSLVQAGGTMQQLQSQQSVVMREFKGGNWVVYDDIIKLL